MRVAPPRQHTRSHHEIGHKPGRLNSASGNNYLDCGRPAEQLYRLPGRVLGLFHILRKSPAQLVLRLETEAVLEKIRNGRVHDDRGRTHGQRLHVIAHYHVDGMVTHGHHHA
jgi:hypothetical protein